MLHYEQATITAKWITNGKQQTINKCIVTDNIELIRTLLLSIPFKIILYKGMFVID